MLLRRHPAQPGLSHQPILLYIFPWSNKSPNHNQTWKCRTSPFFSRPKGVVQRISKTIRLLWAREKKLVMSSFPRNLKCGTISNYRFLQELFKRKLNTFPNWRKVNHRLLSWIIETEQFTLMTRFNFELFIKIRNDFWKVVFYRSIELEKLNGYVH